MVNPLPVDAEAVEIAPGIFVPANRLGELEALMNSDPAMLQAIESMHTCTIEVAPHFLVPRGKVAEWQHRMETDPLFCQAMDDLMDYLNEDGLSDAFAHYCPTPLAQEVLSRRRRSVAKYAFEYGIH